MNKLWSDIAWDEYLYWQQTDKKIVKKINELIKDIERNGLSQGIGHPEPLRGGNDVTYSRRITAHDRIIYDIYDDVLVVLVIETEGHYNDK